MSNMRKLKPVIVQPRVSAEDHVRIQQAALRNNRTVSAWLRDVALRALDAQQLTPVRRVRARVTKKQPNRSFA